MSLTSDIPQVAIKEELTKNTNQKQQILEDFWDLGVTAQTDFVIAAGWKPKLVYDAGALQKEGSSDEYTLTLDVDVYTVVFAIAPTNGNDLAFICERWV